MIVFAFKLVVLLVLTVAFSAISSDVYADSISVTFDKDQYQTGDSLTVTGQVPEVKMPVIAMSIFDPNGQILAANSVEVDSDGFFTKTIFLDSPFYEKSGEYKIKLDYTSLSQNEFFTISNPESTPTIIEESVLPEILELTTDKPKYTDGNIITISGSVSTNDSPTVLIGVYDTFGSPAGFYFGNVDSNLNFSTSFLAKAGVNFKVDGTYSIKAHYAESEKTIEFGFFKILEETIVEETPIEETIVEEIPESTDNSSTQTTEETVETNIDENIDTTSTNSQTESEIIQTNILETDQKNKNETQSNEGSIIQTPNENKTVDKKEPKKDITNKTPKDESDQNKKQDNLTVEDIELGKILNQINLSCDTSKYVDSITYYDGMGPALYRLCNFDGSLQYFDQSLKTEPDNIEFLTNKGSALGKLGFFSEAIVYYDSALEIDPDFLPAINNKANILANQEKFEEAKTLYESAIAKNPNYITARKNLSMINDKLDTQQITSIPQVSEQKPTVVTQHDNSPQKEIAIQVPIKNETKKPTNFLDELSLVFSSLGTLFGFN